MRRRAYMGLIAASGVPLAGCGSLESSSSGDDTTGGGGNNTDAKSSGEDSTALKNHPAASKIDSEPRLGPALDEAEGVIIEFADPSCPGCARFEKKTYPKIKSNLVDSDRVAFIYREYPNVAPWGETASQALEGTFADEASAFWGLKSYYYANTDAIDEDNVLDKTEAYLSEETNVDAAVIVNGVENGEFESKVQQDVDIGSEAGVNGTPAFFLFRSGSFVTKLTGPQDYSVFKNALGV